ncbi:hypothetical protein HZ326_27902 [Fusarium oxysporum f. sp. albedinis]|nr:hypothetical protein HZ326_27902 [Fusarium oxysporum f. sp. albedinis]
MTRACRSFNFCERTLGSPEVVGNAGHRHLPATVSTKPQRSELHVEQSLRLQWNCLTQADQNSRRQRACGKGWPRVRLLLFPRKGQRASKRFDQRDLDDGGPSSLTTRICIVVEDKLHPSSSSRIVRCTK